MEDRELLEAAAKAAGMDYLTCWSERIRDWDSMHHGGGGATRRRPKWRVQFMEPTHRRRRRAAAGRGAPVHCGRARPRV